MLGPSGGLTEHSQILQINADKGGLSLRSRCSGFRSERVKGLMHWGLCEIQLNTARTVILDMKRYKQVCPSKRWKNKEDKQVWRLLFFGKRSPKRNNLPTCQYAETNVIHWRSDVRYIHFREKQWVSDSCCFPLNALSASTNSPAELTGISRELGIVSWLPERPQVSSSSMCLNLNKAADAADLPQANVLACHRVWNQWGRFFTINNEMMTCPGWTSRLLPSSVQEHGELKEQEQCVFRSRFYLLFPQDLCQYWQDLFASVVN